MVYRVDGRGSVSEFTLLMTDFIYVFVNMTEINTIEVYLY